MSQGLDQFGCVGSTIKLVTGQYFDLLQPDPQAITIRAVGLALGKICRFGGHCPQFYSVAEHSLLAAALASRAGEPIEVQRAVLLHDAAEAFIGDITKPLKLLLGRTIIEIEQAIEVAISKRFDVDLVGLYDKIKRYDRALLKAEKLAMWPGDTEQWSGFGEVEESLLFVERDFRWLPPDRAAFEFLMQCSRFGFQ